jgi:hypothetical protein
MARIKQEVIIAKVAELVKKDIDTIPRINWGGCGVVAHNLYKTLDKLNLKPKVVALTVSPESIKDFNPDFDHIILKVGKYYIDSTGYYKTKRDIPDTSRRAKKAEVSFDTLSKWLDVCNWNTAFNKDKYKPIIEKTFKKILRKVKKDLVMSN